MKTDDRAARIEEYRSKSHQADDLVASNQIEAARTLLTACRETAAAAGDEDYRLFFEAELLDISASDLPAELAMLEKALAWRRSEESQKDFFILRTMGVCLSKMGDEKSAIDYFDRALAINPEDYDSLRNKGVCLSKMGDAKSAIDYFDRALAVNPEDYRSLQQKGVSLSKMGDEKSAIDYFDRALAINPNDYSSLRNKGVCLSKMGDAKSAIDYFDRALAINPEDYRSLRQKGVSLSKMGDEKGAIEYYDRALAINPNDYSSLRNKGVSLSKMGDEKSAIDYFDRALAVNPEDYDSLRQKGVSLSNMGDEKGAIEYYDRALAINPEDYRSLRQKGVCLSKMGDEKGAIDYFDRALAVNPDDNLACIWLAITGYIMGDHTLALKKIRAAAKINPEESEDSFRTLMRLLKKDPDREWQKLFPDRPVRSKDPIDRLEEIRDFTWTIRENLGTNGQAFLDQKESAEKKVKNFLQPASLLAQDMTFFLVLRKWNSYTPAIPVEEDERIRGGGYFIYHNGKGTVIDPGYNFIENFHQAGCRIHDIDTIILTHAHNDHTIDFESICTLLHQYNRLREKEENSKKINLYFNNGSFKKFSGMLNLMDQNFETIHTLNAGNEYQISAGMTLNVLPAFHDEVVSRCQSVGLLFTFAFGEKTRKMVFTSDTGLFPLYTYSSDLKPDTTQKELWQEYPPSALHQPDLLVVHIGSIKKEEFTVDLKQGIEKCLYPNHLGIIGTARMITKLMPKLALVSEFGEEMRGFRCEIVQRIEEDVVHKVIKDDPKPRVAPADLAFVYDIANAKFLCCAGGEWTDVAEIAYDYHVNSKKENIYYFSKKELDKVGKSDYASTVDTFKHRRKNRENMYFKSDA